MQEQELKAIAQQIDDGNKVKETLDSVGWQDLIEPILDRMIKDTIGGKVDGRWVEGSLWDDDLDGVEATNLWWYVRGLIDLHNHIYQFIDELPRLEKEYKRKLELEKTPEYVRPMEGSDYDTTIEGEK